MSAEFERKLTAIFSADAVGYSRLMGDDEAATVRTVTAYLELMSTLVQHHRGRVIDTPGDNIMAEFASVVDAVECAVEVQTVLKSRNAELPEHRRMQFRIGINLGDVIVEGDRLYGDGVNIAARLEGLAEPGGICISGTVHEHVRNKLKLWNEYLGRHSVKNIAESVEVYRLLLEPTTAKAGHRRAARGSKRRWVTIGVPVALLVAAGGYLGQRLIGEAGAGPSEEVAVATTDRPTVAVLAFDNMSDDPAQEYFSDGITEDLITDLAKVSGLSVTARNSTFAYKGQAVNVTEVGRELGVAYVVEGSVRQADGRVRINTQLIETASGAHVWADRYDRSLEDIFAVQDEVVAEIVEALRVTLTPDDEASLATLPTHDLAAYDHALRGWWYYQQFTREGNEQARDMFTQALEADPEYADALTGLGFTYYEEWAQVWTWDPEVLNRAHELATASLALDESRPGAHTLLAHVYVWTGRHDLAIEEQERALQLAPTDPRILRDLGEALLFAGRTEEAIGFVQRGMDLDPHHGVEYLTTLAMAYTVLERYGEAVTVLERALNLNPNSMYVLLALAGCNSALGQTDEARRYVTQALAINPQITVEMLGSRMPFRDRSTAEQLLDGLRQAGLS